MVEAVGASKVSYLCRSVCMYILIKSLPYPDIRFVLEGQTLSYYKPNVGRKKGEIITENCMVRSLLPEEAEGRLFALG